MKRFGGSAHLPNCQVSITGPVRKYLTHLLLSLLGIEHPMKYNKPVLTSFWGWAAAEAGNHAKVTYIHHTYNKATGMVAAEKDKHRDKR